MRRLVYLTTLVLALAVAAPAGAVPRHIHQITTPGGTHELGAGASENAPCVAFLNLHFNVHVGVSVAGGNAIGVARVIGPDCPV
jgi:hypothetical protein